MFNKSFKPQYYVPECFSYYHHSMTMNQACPCRPCQTLCSLTCLMDVRMRLAHKTNAQKTQQIVTTSRVILLKHSSYVSILEVDLTFKSL